jgi:hypothetical protein
MAAKFQELTKKLKKQDQGNNRIRLSFDEIERLIGCPLPAQALEYRTWWVNNKSEKNPQAEGWMNAGFIVVTVKFNERWVEFLKIN